jgi:hypothetical protein
MLLFTLLLGQENVSPFKPVLIRLRTLFRALTLHFLRFCSTPTDNTIFGCFQANDILALFDSDRQHDLWDFSTFSDKQTTYFFWLTFSKAFHCPQQHTTIADARHVKTAKVTTFFYPNTMIQNQKSEMCKINGMSFPRKLHAMLEAASKNNLEDVASWQAGGKSFKVIQPQRFATEIMLTYFNQSKYRSFQRQLNIYGFRRVQHGPNKGGYTHKHFIRYSPELGDRIVCRPANQISATVSTALKDLFDSSAPSSDENKEVLQVEPISLIDDLSSSFRSGDFKLHDSEVKTFYDFFYPNDQTDKAGVSNIIVHEGGSIQQDTSWFCSSRRGESSVPSVNNDVEQAFLVLSGEGDDHIENNDDDDELSTEQTSFPWKLHLMLEYAEKQNYQYIVSWVKDGSAFKVHKSGEFVEKVMPKYFDQTKYDSFRRQVNMYGFTRLSRGEGRGAICHPSFVKGARHLCGNIRRRFS